MDISKLKSISRDSYDFNLIKSNALKKAESDIVTVYNNHIFKADANTICLIKTLSENHPTFFVLDTNNNPVEITDPNEFLGILTQKNQLALNTYHQTYAKLKNKEI